MIEARIKHQRDDFMLEADFSINHQGITAVFGPSGCGKTLLLRCIAGLEKCSNSYLRVGETIWQDSQHFMKPHKRKVGYVFQEPSLFKHLNVQQNIEYGLKRSNINSNKKLIEPAIELLNLKKLLMREPTQLSGGEQQRVAIARALSASPSLLLLDEPLAALDYQHKTEILTYLDSINTELQIPMLYVSHSRTEVARLASELMILDNGKIQAQGKLTELFNNLDLPLANRSDAETVIKATVVNYDPEYALATMQFAGGKLLVAGNGLPIGSEVTLQVLANDVSITLSEQQQTSILNIISTTIEQIVDFNEAQVTIKLIAGTTPLLSRITRRSANQLNLKAGDQVFAQVKTVALLS